MNCKYINNLKVINPKVSKKKLYIFIIRKILIVFQNFKSFRDIDRIICPHYYVKFHYYM